jgi:hypothetical protein
VLVLAEAGEDGDDPRSGPFLAEDVAEEDGLELERVLALVIELVGVGIEVAGRGESVDRGEVGLHRAERRRERLPAESERLAHRRVGGAEEDERVGVLRERGGERVVGRAVAARATPRIDVRGDEPDEAAVRGRAVAVLRCAAISRGRRARLLLRRSRRGLADAEALDVDVLRELDGIAVVRATSVGCLANVGGRELALDPRALAAVGRAVDEERVLELGRELHDDLDGDALAELLRGVARDLLAGRRPGEAGDDRDDLHRQDGVRRSDALRVTQHQRAPEAAILDDDGLDGTETGTGRSRGHSGRLTVFRGDRR